MSRFPNTKNYNEPSKEPKNNIPSRADYWQYNNYKFENIHKYNYICTGELALAEPLTPFQVPRPIVSSENSSE